MDALILIFVVAPVVFGLLFALVVYPVKALGVGTQRDEAVTAMAVEVDLAQFATEVVGESNYQAALQAIAGRPSYDGVQMFTEAMLVLDDGNPHDPQAVKVMIAGRLVGYLSRADARAYRKRNAGRFGNSMVCPALIAGGWDRGNGDCGMYGVRLDLRMA